VLQQHSFLAVDRFEIRFPLQKQQTKHVDRWVAFASASRAKHFVLDLSPAVHTKVKSTCMYFQLIFSMVKMALLSYLSGSALCA
jgi:hypothetical protein